MVEQPLDLREMPPPERHLRVHDAFEDLESGETFTVVNDPGPLFYEMRAEVDAFDDDGYTVKPEGPGSSSRNSRSASPPSDSRDDPDDPQRPERSTAIRTDRRVHDARTTRTSHDARTTRTSHDARTTRTSHDARTTRTSHDARTTRTSHDARTTRTIRTVHDTRPLRPYHAGSDADPRYVQSIASICSHTRTKVAGSVPEIGELYVGVIICYRVDRTQTTRLNLTRRVGN
jgi:hypothetical protein